jgi:AraC-like DNA-binding protein
VLEKIYINKPDHTDLNIYRCGIEDCNPGHSWGPAVRDHYQIHYILNGKGSFQVGDKIYFLEKGQGFLISPNIIAHYAADSLEPWSYSWVGFHGLKAESYLRQANLTSTNPVFNYTCDNLLKEYLSQMISTKDMIKGREIKLLGLLYSFLSRLIEVSNVNTIDKNENRKEMYVKKIIEFIEMNYSRDISVLEMSHYIGLDRSYLYSIFKELLNVSPQEFLINLRVNKACELMQNNLLNIGDISRSVGYEDPLLFSKIFKKIKGSSPKEFRKTI